MMINEQPQQETKETKIDPLSEFREISTIGLLKAVFDKADWEQIGSMQRYDIFTNNIRAAAAKNTTIRTFLDCLATELGVASINFASETIDRLEQYQKEILKNLQKETLYYVLRVRGY